MVPEIKTVLEVKDAERALMLKNYNLKQADLDNIVDGIIEWYKKQRHLPCIELDRGFVESALSRTAFSIEKAKLSIDRVFSYKHVLPDFYSNRNPMEIIRKARISGYILPLPTLDSDALRVSIIKAEVFQEGADILHSFRFVLMIGELRSFRDFCLGNRYIFDLQNLTMSHLMTLRPHIIKQAIILEKEVYGIKIKAVHFINVGKFLDRLMMFLKPLLSHKLFKRLHFHSSLEELFEHVSRDILPKDYGGNAGSFYDMIGEWENLASSKQFLDWFHENDKLHSDETKRQGQKITSELLGLPGSFRQLNVD